MHQKESQCRAQTKKASNSSYLYNDPVEILVYDAFLPSHLEAVPHVVRKLRLGFSVVDASGEHDDGHLVRRVVGFPAVKKLGQEALDRLFKQDRP